MNSTILTLSMKTHKTITELTRAVQNNLSDILSWWVTLLREKRQNFLVVVFWVMTTVMMR